MSILNKLKAAKDAKELKLHDVHPLAQESHDSRLRYLSAVAWALGLDREPLPIEQDAFVALADSLSVDAGDARELIAERANVTDEDMATMLEMAKSQKFVYLLDVCWMLVMDGKVGAAEREFLEGIAPMVEVEKKVGDDVLEFLLALRKKDMPALFKNYGLLDGIKGFNEYLVGLLRFTEKNTVNVFFKKGTGSTPVLGAWLVAIGGQVKAGDRLCNFQYGNGGLYSSFFSLTNGDQNVDFLSSSNTGIVAFLAPLDRSNWSKLMAGSVAGEGALIAKIYVPE